MIEITSPQNSLIKSIAKLASSARERQKTGLTILDGEHLIESYQLADPKLENLKYLFVTQEAPRYGLMDDRFIIVPPGLMSKIAPTKSPSGILGVIHTPQTKPISNPTLGLLLEDIADPGNLGTIIRTAVAAGAQTIYCTPNCTDIWSPKVLRASQGAHFEINIQEHYDITELKNDFAGTIYGTALDDTSKNLFETDLSGPTLFAMGNEGSGLSPALKDLCDELIIIPMQGAESLNVGVASGICLFEKVRQS